MGFDYSSPSFFLGECLGGSGKIACKYRRTNGIAASEGSSDREIINNPTAAAGSGAM